MGLVIHVDGGSRGNPGPAGGGVVIARENGELLHEGGYFFGRQTNNVAEYRALIAGLQRAGRFEPQPLKLHSDSQLLVRQVTGEYQVKSPALGQLFHQVQLLLLKVQNWSFKHVPREMNSRADELANLAMDKQRDVVLFDIETGAAAPETPSRRADNSRDGGGEQLSQAPPEPAKYAAPYGRARPMVQISMSRPPRPETCPAGDWMAGPIHVGATLPQGVCVHAAHALLPTLLGMINSDPQEFRSIPTLTVRCSNPQCGAVLHLNPELGGNGQG